MKMFINYKNLTVRNAVADDAGLLASWWNDGSVMAHAGFPLGLGTTAAEIARSLARDSDALGRRLILEVDRVPVGEMNYRDKGGAAEIGIKICDAVFQDRGYGKIFLSLLIEKLFDELHFSKIILDTNVKNDRARHVYERLGFKLLRVNRDAWRDQLGEAQSSADYELPRKAFVRFG